jgi:hypothetical protein
MNFRRAIAVAIWPLLSADHGQLAHLRQIIGLQIQRDTVA